MQDVVVEEEFLFSWAESKEQYDWHMKERIDTNGGVCVFVFVCIWDKHCFRWWCGSLFITAPP